VGGGAGRGERKFVAPSFDPIADCDDVRMYGCDDKNDLTGYERARSRRVEAQ
jgi:hypothetical protein